jgi:hypothetical protein
MEVERNQHERPLFFPKDEWCPELDEMRNEAMAAAAATSTNDNNRQVIPNGRELYAIFISYLIEFWRHEVELQKPQRFFSTVTGFGGETNWWDFDDDECTAASDNVSGGLLPKTRWQEVAETLWTQLLQLDICQEKFDPENARHLKGLAKIFERGDEVLKTIVRNYLSTLN